jgi:hypothetical protein
VTLGAFMPDDKRKRSFEERFDIEVGLEEAKLRFVNRSHNVIDGWYKKARFQDSFRFAVFQTLGMRVPDVIVTSLADEIGKEFDSALKAIEGAYKYANGTGHGHDFLLRVRFDSDVRNLLDMAETDLGIDWQEGQFVRTGAALLDEGLVNDNLHWLRESGFKSVLAPFSKGLSGLLQAESHPEARSDVVRDMYEALEAMAKIQTRPDRDLSSNAESFIKSVGASAGYREVLKAYIKYANGYFRHATSEAQPKPQVSMREAESFVYLTGVFLRLAMPKAPRTDA